MAHKIFVSPQAVTDIESAAAWYDERRARFGDIFLLALQEVFSSIRRYPRMYPVVADEIHRALLAHFPFAVLYRIQGDDIEVLAVFHHKRHPDTITGRLP